MDESRFDRLTIALGNLTGRRRLLTSFALTTLAAGAPMLAADARKKRKKKGNKAKKAKPNEFGCLNVGAACKNADQCCSGVCDGKKGKRKCIAHNAGLCQPEDDYCLGVPRVCEASGGTLSVCLLTTGKAGFCANPGDVGTEGFCRDCTRDADCQAEFGPGAACLDMRAGICADLDACVDTGGTACLAAVV